jgi:serine phosphatase RsbU (regulator of sigma subunit)
MTSRLQAARSGVRRYFTEPLDIDYLLESLNDLSQPKTEAPYRILVVDDDESIRKLLDITLGRAGLQVMTQPDAGNIVEVVRDFKPELIFMDVQMPGCSGPEAAMVLRQNPEFDVIPIVFMSADTELDSQLAALTTGGDDFITKPFDTTHIMVTAVARATRTRGLQQARQNLIHTAKELKRYQATAEHEQQMAQELMNRMIFSEGLADERLQYWHQSASRFSGDLVAAVRDRGGRLYLLHADAMGHGLPAALPLLPVSQIFYSMAPQGFTISAIAETMNNQLRAQIPTGNFVACTLMAIDSQNATVEVWNGGNPTALFVSARGEILQRFHSRHTALGVVPEEEFRHHTTLYQWDSEGQIVLFSDGLAEATNDHNEEFRAHIEPALTEGQGDRLQNLVAELRNHLNGAIAHDDISIVVVQCAPPKPDV